MKTINDIKLSDLKKYCKLNYSRALHEIRQQNSNLRTLDYIEEDNRVIACFYFDKTEHGFKHWHTILNEILEYKNQTHTGTKLLIKFNKMNDWEKLEYMQRIADLLNHIEDKK